jgi:hypothetical protein
MKNVGEISGGECCLSSRRFEGLRGKELCARKWAQLIGILSNCQDSGALEKVVFVIGALIYIYLKSITHLISTMLLAIFLNAPWLGKNEDKGEKG